VIVQSTPGGLLLFRQADHARLTGEFAASLRDPPAPPSAFIAAARLHDNGWIESDADPLLDPATGIPYSFRHMPGWHYRDLWRRGIDRAVAMDPHVGLLVSLHGMQFFGRKADPEDKQFYESERERQTRLLQELGYEGTGYDLPEPIHLQFEWLRFLDGLSLFICDAWESPWEVDLEGHDTFVVEGGDGHVTVDPWPFAVPSIPFRVPCRRLSAPRFDSLEKLRQAYAAAPVELLVGEVRAPGGTGGDRRKASSTPRAMGGP